MRILLTNDDGIAAEGLKALAQVFSASHEVTVCAPRKEQSGMAHALKVHRPMEFGEYEPLRELGLRAYWLDGTPTDCVKLYLEEVGRGEKFDALISGINYGANLATDVLYSGTVGAAMEGFMHGMTALAVSLERRSEISYAEAARLTQKFWLEQTELQSQPFFYNINFPAKFDGEEAKFVFAKLGKRDYLNAYERSQDETGRVFYTVGGEAIDLDKSEGTDIWAAKQGLIAVTPLQTELTDLKLLEDLLR